MGVYMKNTDFFKKSLKFHQSLCWDVLRRMSCEDEQEQEQMCSAEKEKREEVVKTQTTDTAGQIEYFFARKRNNNVVPDSEKFCESNGRERMRFS
ncbi:MAG: hypothetical protein D3921_02705 [Candidatus Electrothrix sp. AW1]|nr:hypothetical protein [Candidatus Electrothrix sp. AX1]MCI5181436.1 hypothetical protein [Candidatus Electrothrix gigas]